jgi:hypothetical protein
MHSQRFLMTSGAPCSGIVPRLKDVMQLPIVNWAWLLSFATWVAEAVFYTFSYYWTGIRDVQVGQFYLG